VTAWGVLPCGFRGQPPRSPTWRGGGRMVGEVAATPGRKQTRHGPPGVPFACAGSNRDRGLLLCPKHATAWSKACNGRMGYRRSWLEDGDEECAYCTTNIGGATRWLASGHVGQSAAARSTTSFRRPRDGDRAGPHTPSLAGLSSPRTSNGGGAQLWKLAHRDQLH
jgi:hypothetical protein